MTRAGLNHEHPHRLAGVREHGGRLWVVVLQNRTGMAVVESRSLDSRDSAGFRDLLRRHKVEEVVRLAPAAETICKSVTVPPGDAAAVSSALALLAEAQLPDALPRYRRASGQIPDDGRTSGLLTGWRGAAAPAALDEDIDERWTTVPAALAVLGGSAPVVAARDDAAVTVLARGQSRTIARVLITEKATDFEQAVRETAGAAGAEAPGGKEDVLLDAAARHYISSHVTGIPSDPSWLRDYALALGAAMVAVESRGLAELFAVAPESRMSIVERSLNWLTVPRRAHAVTAAAVAALLLVPLGVSWGRSLVLGSKVQALDDTTAAALRTDLDRQAALYEALEQTRWPMTKLLADIAAATPVGVVLDSVRLAPETGVALDGTAPSTDHMQQLQAAFNKSGLFRDLKIDRQESTDSGVKFSLSAKVASPHVRVADAEDFAARPLAARLYGDGASNTAYGGSSSSHADAGRRPTRTERPERDEGERDSGPRAPDRPSGTPAVAEVPPPITADEIAKLPAGQAGSLWSKRKAFLSATPNVDQATKDRITAEIDLLFPRMKADIAAKSSAAAPPAPPGGGR